MIYDFLKIVFPLLFKVLFRCKIIGTEHIPQQGGVIIAANHSSNWDPPLVASFSPRYVHFMAKQELFEIPLFGYIINKLHAFPVKRGTADRGAIKMAIQRLQNGECLGLFPEGTRSQNGDLKKPEAGIALIAIKAGVPVVPAALIGTNRIFSFGCFLPKLRVVYGAPIYYSGGQSDKVALQEFSLQIMAAVENLMNQRAECEGKI